MASALVFGVSEARLAQAMGTRKKFVEKYQREPTAEELATFKAKLEKKAAKKERKKEQAPAGAATVESPAAAAVATPSPAAPSGGKQAGSKRKRAEVAPSAALFASPAGLGRTASKSFVTSMAALSKAVDKGAAASAIPDAAFEAAWESHKAGAEALLDQFESSLPARLTEEQRGALLQPYRERLGLSLTAPEAVLERCRRKHAAAEKVKADARAAKAATRPPKPPKEHALNETLRDAGLEILKRFEWDVMTACEGAAAKGYLSNDHLKHLAIYKGVYAAVAAESGANAPGKVKLMSALVKKTNFDTEAAAAHSVRNGGRSGSSSDDSHS